MELSHTLTFKLHHLYTLYNNNVPHCQTLGIQNGCRNAPFILLLRFRQRFELTFFEGKLGGIFLVKV